jgi:hypothetical protein
VLNPLASLGLAAIIAAVAFGAGWKVASDHYAAQGVKTLVKTITVTKEIGAAATQAGVQAQATRDRIIYKTQVLHDQVPILLGADADLRLPAGWLSGYNSSLGLVPAGSGPSGVAGDQAGSIRADDALRTTITNNGQCLALAAQVNGLLDRYEQVKQQVNGER